MAKIDGDHEELSYDDARLVRGMLHRGDSQHHIAAWFGVDSRAVSHVKNGKSHPGAEPAAPAVLPPPGPYQPDPAYIRLYQRMVQVNELWDQGHLRDAKAALEAILKSPMIQVDSTDMELLADDLLRDEFGRLML